MEGIPRIRVYNMTMDETVAVGEVREVEVTPEQKVADVVAQADALFVRREMPNAPGERQMICGFASDVVTRTARREGLEANKYQLLWIHRELGMPSKHEAFQHGMNVIKAGDQLYLVDISFCQFMDPETGEIRQAQYGTGIQYKGNPLAQELLTKGYFRLTDQSLRDYLIVSSATEDKSYIKDATVGKLLAIDPRRIISPPDHDDSYMDRYLDGATWPEEPSAS